MNTRKIAGEYRMAHWAQIMQERTASGKSVREFCKSAGYREHVYYYWQRKLREAACRELIPTGRHPEAAAPKGWVACAVEKEKARSGALTIEIGQYKVITDADMDTELLAKVLRVLGSIC